jgi:uncharacterized membrane protein YbhN (UPF0104 family)
MVTWLIRAAVSAVVVVVLLAIVPLDSVMAALRRVSPWTWAASAAIFFVGHFLNAVKLRLLIGDGPSLGACVRAQYAGLVANLGLPGLASGDFVRAAYLVPIAGVARMTAASVLDRVIDTATVLVLVAVALPIAGAPPEISDTLWQALLWIGAAAAGVAAIVGIALVMKRTGPAGKLIRGLQQAWAALDSRRPALAGAVVISLGVQVSFVLTNVWLARQAGVGTGLAPWFVAWPLSKLVAVLPISLGGIGVREAALVTLLVPYGAPRDAVLASGFLWQGVLIVTALAGLAVTQLTRPQDHE